MPDHLLVSSNETEHVNLKNTMQIAGTLKTCHCQLRVLLKIQKQ